MKDPIDMATLCSAAAGASTLLRGWSKGSPYQGLLEHNVGIIREVREDLGKRDAQDRLSTLSAAINNAATEHRVSGTEWYDDSLEVCKAYLLGKEELVPAEAKQSCLIFLGVLSQAADRQSMTESKMSRFWDFARR
jgi:hypothetical protein